MDLSTYNEQTKRYQFKESFIVKGREVKVTIHNGEPEYHPTCIMMHKNGFPKIMFLMNRLCFKDNGFRKEIDTDLST